MLRGYDTMVSYGCFYELEVLYKGRYRAPVKGIGLDTRQV